MHRIGNQLCVLLAATALTTGCGGTSDVKKPSPASANQTAGKNKADKGGEHEHGHEHGAGPHGGTLADWGGGQYHVELTVDHDKQEATVYILGSDEKTPVPIKAKEGAIELSIQDPAFQISLTAKPLEGDPNGSASRFVGTHENLGNHQEFGGTITGELDGTPYAGDFKEEPDDGHRHAHGGNQPKE